MAEHVDRGLSGIDAMMWRTGRAEPAMRWVITAVFLLDAAPPWDRFERSWRAAAAAAPPLRARLAYGLIGITPRLVSDADFDVDRHLQRVVLRGSEHADPWQEVLDLARSMSRADFDESSPLWRAALVEGLAGEQAAVVVVLHHAIADGRAALQIATGLFQTDPDADADADPDTGPPPEAEHGGPDHANAGTPRRSGPSRLALTRGDARDVAGRLVRIGAKTASMAGEFVRHPQASAARWAEQLQSLDRIGPNRDPMLSPLMTGRSDSYRFATQQVPFDTMRRAARRHHASVNDVFVAGLCAGLASYHERHGAPAPRLRFAVSISMRERVRAGRGSPGNAVALATLELPVNAASNAQRLVAVHAGARRWRAEPALHVSQRLVDLHWLVPVSRLLAGARGNDVGASNVSGPPVPVFLAGQRVLGLWPLVSPVGTAVNVTLISYAGDALLGIVADEAAVPDIDVLAQDLRAGLKSMLA